MPKALNIIRAEHRSIAAILHGMQHLVGQIRERKAKIDPKVFRAMLYYLDTFSERVHHPKEDRFLFDPLRRRGAGPDALIAELERDHAEGGASLRRVEQCLIRYEEGGEKEFPEFAREVDRFVERYGTTCARRKNMCSRSPRNCLPSRTGRRSTARSRKTSIRSSATGTRRTFGSCSRASSPSRRRRSGSARPRSAGYRPTIQKGDPKMKTRLSARLTLACLTRSCARSRSGSRRKASAFRSCA